MEVPHGFIIKYIERRKMDLEICLDSLESKQYEKIAKIGHQLKGNGATFGYPELSNVGEKIEEAAKRSDPKALGSTLEEFSRIIETLH